MRAGVVTFVGLGPGDPTLWTERAAHRIAGAEARVDDDPPASARLIELARQGKRVVRTVAGDPFESPDVVAEALQVAAAGIEVEVVPGVGASGAAAALAGVVSRAILTRGDKVGTAIGAAAHDAPVTLVVNPSLPAQRIVVTTAARAADLALSLGSLPVIVAFGLPRDSLRWFERRPLFGKSVLVTRAREQAGSTAARLREEGAEVIIVPTIELRDPGDAGPLARALSELRAGAYGWVAFTSANGVERTWGAIAASGGDARVFGSAKLAAIGPATARALEGHGLRADVVAKEFRGEGLAKEMLLGMGMASTPPRVLLARAARARDALPDALRAAGCLVDVVAAYETHPASSEAVATVVGAFEQGRVDAALFTSSSTVENFCTLVGPRAIELLKRTRVASIGPVTTATALALGVRVDVTAREYTVPGLVDALIESYA